MKFVFFLALLLSLYSYALYPPLLRLAAKLVRKKWRTAAATPALTVIISAYNEEKDIRAKLENTLALDYPREKLEIIVSSDGSTDATNDIVASLEDERLRLRAFGERLGKTACLNRVIPETTGEIILFTDANSMFPPQVLRRLAANFADQTVGAVTGWTKYHNAATGEETTGMYARLEKATKVDESMISSCVGADGAIFAIRRELYVELGANDINDLIIPLNVVRQNRRVILDPEVYCEEDDPTGLENIFNRQVRITTRTAWAIWRNRGLLNPIRFPSFAFLLLSHKVLRLLTPFFLLATLALNLSLIGESPFFLLTLAAQLLFLSIALGAIAGLLKGRIASLCKYLLVTFAAHFKGCLRMAMGREDIIWTPKR